MKYRTEPLQAYNWAKELRLKHLKAPMTAREEGKFVVGGMMNICKELITGIGDFALVAMEPWAVFNLREGGEKLALECFAATESRGYASDLCSYSRLSWGSMFLNKSPWGVYPRPDFVVYFRQCDTHAQFHRVESEHFGVPVFAFDSTFSVGDGTYKIADSRMQYLVAQYYDFIDWLKKTTGRPYNEELMIKAIANCYRSRCLFGEVVQISSAIPCPWEQKLMLPFRLAVEYYPHEDETVALLTALRDEMKYRVHEGITPLPEEKCRVLYDGMSPWYALYMFAYLRHNGVAVVCGPSEYIFSIPAQTATKEGEFDPQGPYLWNEIPKTVDEAIRYRAYCQVIQETYIRDTRVRVMTNVETARALNCTGMIFILDRGCKLSSYCVSEIERSVKKSGISTVSFEANRVDVREWSWPHVQDTLDSFMESLGIAVDKEKTQK